MRSSDWSSDVCSSDLLHATWSAVRESDSSFSLRHLSAFMAALEQGRIAGASRRMRRSSSAIARSIGILEQELRSEEHTSELQSLMRISYAVFCLKKKKNTHKHKDMKHYCTQQN